MRFFTSKWGDAIHLGPFIEWEPWYLRIGIEFLPFIFGVEFEGAFTKGARKHKKELQAKGEWEGFIK